MYNIYNIKIYIYIILGLRLGNRIPAVGQKVAVCCFIFGTLETTKNMKIFAMLIASQRYASHHLRTHF